MDRTIGHLSSIMNKEVPEGADCFEPSRVQVLRTINGPVRLAGPETRQTTILNGRLSETVGGAGPRENGSDHPPEFGPVGA